LLGVHIDEVLLDGPLWILRSRDKSHVGLLFPPWWMQSNVPRQAIGCALTSWILSTRHPTGNTTTGTLPMQPQRDIVTTS
jgi:hypothetical protein